MIGLLSAYDENEKQASKEKISFVHINSSRKKDIKDEMSPHALALAREFNLEKVYLFYGKDKKIIYDYTLQS